MPDKINLKHYSLYATRKEKRAVIYDSGIDGSLE